MECSGGVNKNMNTHSHLLPRLIRSNTRQLAGHDVLTEKTEEL